MVMVALEFMFRHPYKLEDLVNLMKEKARTLSVSSAPEGGQNFRWFVTHKKYGGQVVLLEMEDGTASGTATEANMILGAFVDWINRQGVSLVYGLNIRFR